MAPTCDLSSYFTPSPLAQMTRLAEHRAPSLHPDLQNYPTSKRAAVLILLFELNRDGVLRVLLTTRSKHLRSHPGQTALPGGKVDASDEGVVETALREAYEEIELPLHLPELHVLTTLRPFLSLYKLMVTPVVAVLTDSEVLGKLKCQEDEVERIFHHPLEAVLDPNIMNELGDFLAEKHGPDWPYETDLHDTSDAMWLDGTQYRMHRFRTSQTPIKGLTSDILICAATVAFDRPSTYERYAPTQLDSAAAIAVALREMEKPTQNNANFYVDRQQLANA